MNDSPAFGRADLTNCERELIHLAGSVQPHGALLVLRESDLSVRQASANTGALLGVPPQRLLERPVSVLGGTLEARLRALLASAAPLDEPAALRCELGLVPGPCDLSVHRLADGAGLVVEFERAEAVGAPSVELDAGSLRQHLAAAVQRISSAPSIGLLADTVVQLLRELTGHDRVMVYRFDPDGHGKIIAEAREARLEPLLGHHYPASDIPQRARELYLRNRVRLLVDVHYVPVPLVPPRLPDRDQELDMSMCHLRSMSPLHLQYLRNMGVTATLVISLVRDGRLWGLVAAHHDSPRHLGAPLRAACALLAEVISTRIAAIENYAHAQVAILVRRLEQRLIEATSTEGDWRLALFRNPRTLLQPLEASGAALFHDEEILTSGEVPSTPELRALLAWVDREHVDSPFACSRVGRENPALESLAPLASGVLAVKLSATRPDYLMWFRKEQLMTVTWAGDPHKPALGNDPLELSPRRSFAAWSEIVRGTAVPWSSAELVLARALGVSLADIILQVHAVRLVIAEHQLRQTRGRVDDAREPVAIADAAGRIVFVNQAFASLVRRPPSALQRLDQLCGLFAEPETLRRAFDAMELSPQPWRGELVLQRDGDGAALPVGVRIEVVPGRDGRLLGSVLALVDRSDSRRVAAARRQLEDAIARAAGAEAAVPGHAAATDEVVAAILTNASLAAMDIAEAPSAPIAPVLEEVEAATRRAAALYAKLQGLVGP